MRAPLPRLQVPGPLRGVKLSRGPAASGSGAEAAFRCHGAAQGGPAERPRGKFCRDAAAGAAAAVPPLQVWASAEHALRGPAGTRPRARSGHGPDDQPVPDVRLLLRALGGLGHLGPRRLRGGHPLPPVQGLLQAGPGGGFPAAGPPGGGGQPALQGQLAPLVLAPGLLGAALLPAAGGRSRRPAARGPGRGARRRRLAGAGQEPAAAPPAGARAPAPGPGGAGRQEGPG
mmetsp:Transcript_26690/g.84696  ORF Transcript_26690/g.84696 Transcript_26690/m.84696 type:complete len:230 (-) Transcript_26690:1568-2257(-)